MEALLKGYVADSTLSSFTLQSDPVLQHFLELANSSSSVNAAFYAVNRPFAANDHVLQNPPCWRASSLLFPHWDIKTKRPEPVKLDLPLYHVIASCKRPIGFIPLLELNPQLCTLQLLLPRKALCACQQKQFTEKNLSKQIT